MPGTQISTGHENTLGAVQGFEAGRYRRMPDARVTVLVNSLWFTSEGLAALSPENSRRVPIPVQTQEPPCGTSAVLTTTCATPEALA